MSKYTEQLRKGRRAGNFCTVDYSDKANYLNRRDAIKLYCASCYAGNTNEVRNCPSKTCPLWPFRNGRDPRGRAAREYTPEQRAAAAERLRQLRTGGAA
jgi:hypothetical protein